MTILSYKNTTFNTSQLHYKGLFGLLVSMTACSNWCNTTTKSHDFYDRRWICDSID